MSRSTTVSTIKAAGLLIGDDGSELTQLTKGTVAVTVAALAADAEADVTVTITGAAAGDLVLVIPADAAMETGVAVLAAWVSAADTVKIRVANLHTSTLTGSTSNWTYLLVK